MNKDDALREICARVREILAIEYKQLYGEAVNEATRIVKSTPGQSCNEIRNAFDHSVTTFEAVERIATADTLSLVELSTLSETAIINAERGRRHIALATFYWLREELRSQRMLIRQTIRTTNLSRALSVAEYKQELEVLEGKIEALRKIAKQLPVEPRYSKQELDVDMQSILSAIDFAFEVLKEHQQMYVKLQTTF